MFFIFWGIFGVKFFICVLKDCFFYFFCFKKGSVFFSLYVLMFFIKLICLFEKGCYKCN